ncbi:hypothetical protein M413DRAFT_200589 [Hebeloma cylindrosporum]|uniref:Uncharacterized protein n=1 Tax=Hebeloma cylindrosporum TaxID=76867 RepID=A0A0C2YC76_HEBCY|nr:hypothetical protein M413DRAFT_200589 [Hebeloma cylindrosporum h7]
MHLGATAPRKSNFPSTPKQHILLTAGYDTNIIPTGRSGMSYLAYNHHDPTWPCCSQGISSSGCRPSCAFRSGAVRAMVISF